MTRIVVHALHSDGQPRRWTLSERIVADNLDSDHYVAQLIERLRWATADAESLEALEALESPSAGLASHEDGDEQPLPPSIRSRGAHSSRGFGSRPGATDRRVKA